MLITVIACIVYIIELLHVLINILLFQVVITDVGKWFLRLFFHRETDFVWDCTCPTKPPLDDATVIQTEYVYCMYHAWVPSNINLSQQNVVFMKYIFS